MKPQLPTPRIVIDQLQVRSNLPRMSEYAAAHGIRLRPHTKTHKSKRLARMQLDCGACGLTVAKAGEAAVMVQVADDLLLAYPTADALRCAQVARLAQGHTLRVGLDSCHAADQLSQAAAAVGSTVGALVDIDVGLGRTGVQSPLLALHLGQHIDRAAHLRLDGIMFYPGQVTDPATAAAQMQEIDALLNETIGLWARHGLAATIVSGGSTPTALLSHCMAAVTEIRPGTYVFYDLNCVRGGCAALEDCAAHIVTTVVSDAVPGQVVIDAGSKTLTSDRCGPDPDSGFGYVVEFPHAKITRLTEEHAQVNVVACDPRPRIGQQLTVIPNHICPCVNLQDQLWWREDQTEHPIPVDARGRVF